jgi:hypothetical protein
MTKMTGLPRVDSDATTGESVYINGVLCDGNANNTAAADTTSTAANSQGYSMATLATALAFSVLVGI